MVQSFVAVNLDKRLAIYLDNLERYFWTLPLHNVLVDSWKFATEEQLCAQLNPPVTSKLHWQNQSRLLSRLPPEVISEILVQANNYTTSVCFGLTCRLCYRISRRHMERQRNHVGNWAGDRIIIFDDSSRFDDLPENGIFTEEEESFINSYIASVQAETGLDDVQLQELADELTDDELTDDEPTDDEGGREFSDSYAETRCILASPSATVELEGQQSGRSEQSEDAQDPEESRNLKGVTSEISEAEVKGTQRVSSPTSSALEKPRMTDLYRCFVQDRCSTAEDLGVCSALDRILYRDPEATYYSREIYLTALNHENYSGVDVSSKLILRNLTTKEYVRGEAFLSVLGGSSGSGWRLGNLLILLACWSSNSGRDTPFEAELSRGPWAGHRIDIIDGSTFPPAEDNSTQWLDRTDDAIARATSLSEYIRAVELDRLTLDWRRMEELRYSMSWPIFYISDD